MVAVTTITTTIDRLPVRHVSFIIQRTTFMLNYIIQFALRNRLIILCGAIAVLIAGGMVTSALPIDVLPNLTRPRVVIVTECEGLAPERG